MESNTCLQRSVDRDLQEFILAALAVEVFMAIFLLECKVYDLTTAAIFAWCLGFLVRGKFVGFYLLYPVGCLNRETMFLLSLFFMVKYFWKLNTVCYLLGLVYQGSAFLGIRLLLMTIYKHSAGQDFYFWPGQILSGYWRQPLDTLLLISLFGTAIYLACRRWREKPAFLRTALLTILPLQLVLHLTMGMPFEIRVFAEVFPVIWVLMVYQQ